MEYFEAGTEPADYCEVHTSAYICSETGLLANEYCPGYYQICIIRPDDIKGGPAKGYTEDSYYSYPYGYCTVHNAETAANAGEDQEGREGDGEEGGNDQNDDQGAYIFDYDNNWN